MATGALNVATANCSEINKPYFSQILQLTIQSGDSKAFVATFVATQRMWLDTTALKQGWVTIFVRGPHFTFLGASRARF